MGYMGIDIGGTLTKAVFIDGEGRTVGRWEVPTNADGSIDAIIEAIETCCDELSTANQAESIARCALAIPGIVDPEKGDVVFAPNLGWHTPVPLAYFVERQLGIPMRIANDAVCAGVGEANFGAARCYRRALMLTLGTAVGAAYIVDGESHDGFGRFGGELGHIPIHHGGRPCSCGTRGCFEQYGSVSALLALTEELISREGASAEEPSVSFAERFPRGSHDVLAAWECGDAVAAAAVSSYTTYLAEGIGGLVNIFRPDVVVIGGGIAENEKLVSAIGSKLPSHIYASHIIGCPPVKAAELGSFAGALGAAHLAQTAER